MNNYQYFLQADLQKYAGEWVAICNDRIVAHGRDSKKVFDAAERVYPGKTISLSFVPVEETMLF